LASASHTFAILSLACFEVSMPSPTMPFAMRSRCNYTYSCSEVGTAMKNSPRSSRLTYRPAKDTDSSFLQVLEREPGVAEFIGRLSKRDPTQRAEYVEFIVCLEGEAIGLVGFIPSDAFPGDFELIAALLESVRCNGYASESCAAALALAWAESPWQRVMALVDIANSRAIELTEGLGFTPADHRVLARPLDYHEVRSYELRRPDR
jgi:RimJ/RimL family protein N-acetyltransferase